MTRVVQLTTVGLFVCGSALLPGAAWLLASPAPLPDGPGKKEFVQVCSGCHPVDDAVAGPRRSRDGWRQVVQEMVVRGAEGSDQDLALVVAYLTEHFGPQ